MASQTYGNDNFVVVGSPGVRDIATTTRRYDLSDLTVYQGRRWAILDWILRTEMPKLPVTDMEPKVLTRDEAPQTFSCNANSITTTRDEDTLLFTNTNARYLVVGDELTCMDIFCDSDGANYSTTKFNSGYTPETMVIDSIELDGYASGTAKVVVRRGNGYNPTSSVTTVTTDFKFMRQGSAFEDNWEAPESTYEEPGSVQNYLQVFDITASETEIHKYMQYYGKISLEQLTEIKRDELLRRIEYTLIFGRKGKVYVNNRTRFKTGGLLEYIPLAATAKDGQDRLMDFGGAFDVKTFREKLEIIGRYGSGEKLVLMGGAAFTIFMNYFEDYLVVNDVLTTKWGGYGVGKVWTWDAGHVTLNIMRHPGFTDFTTSTTTWSNDMLFVDLKYVQLMHLQNMDITLRTGIQETGTHEEKNEWYGVLGLKRTFPEAHAYIYGITG